MGTCTVASSYYSHWNYPKFIFNDLESHPQEILKGTKFKKCINEDIYNKKIIIVIFNAHTVFCPLL